MKNGNRQKNRNIIVIGGGIGGCAVHRKFALMSAKTLLLEKGGDILSGASKANSALLRIGFDAPPGSLKPACMQDGYIDNRFENVQATEALK